MDKRHNNQGREPVMEIIVEDTGIRSMRGIPIVFVNWTCPKKVDGHPCLKRNRQRFFGRADHICIECEQWTNIKGEAPSLPPEGTLA